MVEIALNLAPETLAALERIAAVDDCSVGQVIRDAIKRELYRRGRAKKAVRPDERLIAPLRALLADDFAYARSWGDLQDRLRAKGFALVEAGGGLALHRAGGGKLCKGSDLGYGYAALVRRFEAPFPHSTPQHHLRHQGF